MQIIICGAGRVGSGIAAQLAAENNDITIIDSNKETLDNIGSTLDVRTIHGFACHPSVLESAGAEDADMLIAVTSSDEVNMIACFMAKHIFNIHSKIARIRNQNYLMPEHQNFYSDEKMPIDVIISPEIEVAKNILNRFHVPGATDTFPIENSNIRVIAARLFSNCQLIGLTFNDIKNASKHLNATYLGISRGEKFIIPHDREKLLYGDEIYFVTDNPSAVEAMVLLGHEEKEARKVVIIGGGNIGGYIAKELENEKDVRIKIIERNKHNAEHMAETLTRSIVINGDALEREILEEANVARTETVISVTNDDEVNILSALLAKTLGAQTTYALVNNHTFSPLMSSIGIDVSINPKETTVSSILRHIRRGRIRSAHTLKGGLAEVIEAEVSENLGMVGQQLNELDLPNGVVIGCLLREGDFIKPDPEVIIRKRDRVVLLALSDRIKEVEDMFSLQNRYF